MRRTVSDWGRGGGTQRPGRIGIPVLSLLGILVTIAPVRADGASSGASGRLVYCQTQAGDTQIPREAREVARLGPEGPVVFAIDQALIASAREAGFRFTVVKGARQTGGTLVSTASDDGFVIAQQAESTLSNEYVTIVIDENGVFTMRRTDDDAKLLYGLTPWSSVMTVKVDDTALSTHGELTASRLLQVDTQAGTADVEYTVQGVKFVHSFELAGPAVRFRMTVTNNDSRSHQVAVRYLFDTQIADNDGAPISAEGVVDSSGSSVITYETEVTDVRFTEWKDYDRWPEPTLVGIGTIESIPSRMVFAYWGNAYSSVYDYVYDPQLRFYTPEGQAPPYDPNDPNTWSYYYDSAVLVYFDLDTLPSGATREVTTAYGLGTPTGGGLAQTLRSLRHAIASYHRGAIRSVASGDVGLAKRIHADSGLRAMLEEFAEDIQSSGALLRIVARVLKNPLLAESRAWMQKQIEQLAGNVDVEAGAWILDHVEDWFGSEATAIDWEGDDAAIAADIEAYLTERLAGIAARADGALAVAIAALPSEFPEGAPVEEVIRQLEAIRAKILQLTPQPGVAAEQEVCWAMPGTCTFAPFGDLNPMLLGISSSVAENLRYMGDAADMAGALTAVRGDVCLHWGAGGGILKAMLSLGGAGWPVTEAMYWQQAGACALAVAVNSSIDVDAKPYALWSHYQGLSSLVSDLRAVEAFFERTLSAGADALMTTETCSTDVSVSVLNVADVQADVDDADVQVTAGVQLTNGGAQTAAARGLLQVFRKRGDTYDELVLPLANGQEVQLSPSGGVGQLTFSQRVPAGSLLVPGHYLAKATVVSSAGLNSRAAYMTVCRGLGGCWDDDTWSVVASGALEAGESQEVRVDVPPDAAQVEFTLAYQGSDMDLHLLSASGVHLIGVNYNTGEVENSVAGATYSGPTALSETIAIPASAGSQFRVRVVGVTTIGAEDFTVLQLNAHAHPAVLFAETWPVTATGRPGQTAQFLVGVREIGGQSWITGLAASSSDLVGPGGSTIPASAITVIVPAATVAPGGSVGMVIRVPVDAGLPLGRYTGTINVTSSGGNPQIPLLFDVIQPRRLTVVKQGRGSVNPDEGLYLYNHGAAVVLTATPVAHGSVKSWSGVASVSQDKLTATAVMDADKTVTVTFEVMGRLTVDSRPVKGEVFVNDESWGIAPQTRYVAPGVSYAIRFGPVEGYIAPEEQHVVVGDDDTKSVVGTYAEIPPLEVSATALPQIIAAGQGCTLTAGVSGGVGPYAYSWAPGLGLDEPSVAVHPTETTTYTVTVTDASSQTAQASVTVTVADAVVLSVSANPSIAASGQTSRLTAAASGGLAPYAYRWQTGQTDPMINVLVLETMTYSVEVTDALGQTATDEVTVALVEGPSISATAEPSAIAVGQSSTITTVATGGAPPLTYFWSTGQSGQDLDTITVAPSRTTNYTVTVRDALSQTAQAQAEVVVAGKVTASASASPSTVAAGGRVALKAAGSGGYGQYSYVWNTGQTGDTAEVNPTTTTRYTVTVTDALGQTDEGSVTVSVVGGVVVSATASPATIPSGGGSALQASASGGLSPYTYVWSTSQTGGTIAVSPEVTTTYSVQAYDSLNQSAKTTVTVTVADKVSVSASASAETIVLGQSAILTASGSGGVGPYTYLWSDGQGGEQISVSPVEATTYTVTARDTLGQTASASVELGVASLMKVRIQRSPQSGRISPGGQADLTANVTGGVPPLSYEWSTGQTDQTITVDPDVGTMYTLTVTDTIAQTATAQAEVEVVCQLTIGVTGPGLVEQTPSGQTTFAAGDTVRLKAVPLADGDRFVGWGGDTIDTEAEITVVMNADKRITAVFADADAAAGPCMGAAAAQFSLTGLAVFLLIRTPRRRTRSSTDP